MIIEQSVEISTIIMTTKKKEERMTTYRVYSIVMHGEWFVKKADRFRV